METKPVSEMSREEIIEEIRKVRERRSTASTRAIEVSRAKRDKVASGGGGPRPRKVDALDDSLEDLL